jgi:uncharacterized phage protein (TIGR02220 family)
VGEEIWRIKMSKEQKYMILICKHRKDGSFTLSELAEWISEEDKITYSASRSKANRLIKRLPCEALSLTMFKLLVLPEVKNEKPVKSKEVSLIDSYQEAKEIVSYLNQKAGTKFMGKVADLTKIRSRLSEGHTLQDCKIVIDKKVKEWKGGTMEKYLRVETLFGSKFEGYLNQSEINGKTETMLGYDFTKYTGAK